MKTLLTLLLSFTLLGCSDPQDPPTTAKNVNLQKYMGKWYEIASFPNRFQKGCRCTTAEYHLTKPNRVSILNRCIKNQNKDFTQAKGKAWAPDINDPSKLKVQFFWPFRGNYWILYLDKNYQYVLIGAPKRQYLWILARTKTLQKTTYNKLVNIAKEKGFDVRKLKMTQQNCNN